MYLSILQETYMNTVLVALFPRVENWKQMAINRGIEMVGFQLPV